MEEPRASLQGTREHWEHSCCNVATPGQASLASDPCVCRARRCPAGQGRPQGMDGGCFWSQCHNCHVGHGQRARWCRLHLTGCLPSRKGFSDSSNIYQLGSSSGAGCVRLSVLPLCLGRRLLLPAEINVCGLPFYNPFGCSSGSLQPVLVFIVQPWHEQAARSPSLCVSWVGRGTGGGLPPAGKPQGGPGRSRGGRWWGAGWAGWAGPGVQRQLWGRGHPHILLGPIFCSFMVWEKRFPMGASAHPRIRPGGTRWRWRLKDLLCIPRAWVQMGAWHCCDNSAGLSPACRSAWEELGNLPAAWPHGPISQ